MSSMKNMLETKNRAEEERCYVGNRSLVDSSHFSLEKSIQQKSMNFKGEYYAEMILLSGLRLTAHYTDKSHYLEVILILESKED